jgi:hypothetical protein
LTLTLNKILQPSNLHQTSQTNVALSSGRGRSRGRGISGRTIGRGRSMGQPTPQGLTASKVSARGRGKGMDQPTPQGLTASRVSPRLQSQQQVLKTPILKTPIFLYLVYVYSNAKGINV